MAFNSQGMVELLVAFSGLLGIALFLAIRKPSEFGGKIQRNIHEAEVVDESRLSRRESEELGHLLRSFGLPLNATEQELTRSFRGRARVLHPDTGTGSTREFTELTDRYHRAKDLLSRR